MWKWLKSLIYKDIPTRDLPAGYSKYNDILNTRFAMELDFEEISADLIYLIINNDFVINPAQVIVLFKDKYNLTVDEFFILMFKLGMISELYIHNPASLIAAALGTIKDKLPKEKVLELEAMHAEYTKQAEDAGKREPSKEQEELDIITDIMRRLRSNEEVKNEEVNKVIDYWKKRNNKR